jgi:hypothetical protein
MQNVIARVAAALGRSFLDGIIAYGLSMHGLPWPAVAKFGDDDQISSSKPEDPDAPSKDLAELIALLNTQSDRVR